MQIAEIDENGFGIIENVLSAETVFRLTQELAKINDVKAVSKRNDSVYGVRNLLNFSTEIRKFSESETVKKISQKFLGENAKVVRAIYFNKTAEANWKVPWHQDVTIAVKEKRATRDFSAWTIKAGVQHVQPPLDILEKMITLRFHLDDADEANGALKVIPKTHKKGRLSAEEIKSLREANETYLCSVKKGDCIIMRPLILHSSAAGKHPKNRRVIHFEFAAESLPNGLNWYET